MMLPAGDDAAAAYACPDSIGIERNVNSRTRLLKSSEAVPRIVPGDQRSAERCRMAAAAMEKHIKAKHDSANRTLALPPTRKRIQEADAQRRQAIRLERVQRTLEVLAQMHELGTITPELTQLTSKAAVESALFNQPSESAIHAIFKAADRTETNAEQALRLTQEAL